MAKEKPSDNFRIFLLAFIAPSISIFLRWWMWADPAHVLLYPDPDFGYLFNSLLILDGESPWHIDHPGTPIQLLGALLMKVRFALAGTSPSLHKDFFSDPVPYHQWISHALFGFFIVAQGATGYKLLRLQTAPLLAVSICLLPLTFFDLLDYFDHVSPETLLTGTCLLAVPYLYEAASGRKRASVAAGALLAVACTLKATALPLMFFLFLIPTRRNRLWALGSAVFFYLGITAPIWSEFPRMLSWYINLGIRPGVYGQGSGAPTSSFQLAANLRFLLSSGQWNANLPALILFPALLCLPTHRLRRWPVCAAATLLLFLIVKHPATRYLLPFVAPVAFAILRMQDQAKWRQILIAGLLLAPAPFLMYMPANGRTMWRAQEGEVARMIEERLSSSDYKDCNVTLVNELGHKAHALFAGNFATKTENYGSELRAMYPHLSFIFTQVRFPGSVPTPLEWKSYLASAPCHLFIGRPPRAAETIHKTFAAEIDLTELFGESGSTAIYRVRDTTKLVLPAPQTFVPAGPVGALVSPPTL